MAQDGLTQRQRRFIAAMLAHPSIKEAARAAGIGERTAHVYLSDPNVKAALAGMQAVVMHEATQQAVASLTEAIGVLREIATNPGEPPAQRVSAARALLENGRALFEDQTVIGELTEIRRLLEQET